MSCGCGKKKKHSHHHGGHSSHSHSHTHKTTHHASHHHKTHHSHSKKTHHSATGKKRTSSAVKSGFATTAAAAAGIVAKPSATDQLIQQVASALLTGGFAAQIISAVEAVVGTQMSSAPGKLMAGVVSNSAGALQTPTGGEPYQAMVFLNGSAQAVPAVVPTHLIPDISTGAQVWVQAINGRADDLMIHSIRAFTSSPASASYLNGSSSLNGANVTGTVGNATNATNASNVPASGVTAGTFAAGVILAMEQLTSGSINTIAGTTAGQLLWAMPLRTPLLKAVVVYLNGYKNASASPQNFALPTDFSTWAIVMSLHDPVGGTGFVFRTSGGVVINANQIVLGSGGSGGSSGAHGNVFAYSLQTVNGAIHSIDSPISNTSTGSGPMLVIGF